MIAPLCLAAKPGCRPADSQPDQNQAGLAIPGGASLSWPAQQNGLECGELFLAHLNKADWHHRSSPVHLATCKKATGSVQVFLVASREQGEKLKTPTAQQSGNLLRRQQHWFLFREPVGRLSHGCPTYVGQGFRRGKRSLFPLCSSRCSAVLQKC